MSEHMNIAGMVETTLLRRILIMMRLTQFVSMDPLYNSVLPPTMMRTRWFLALLGLMDTTICPYITVFPSGTADR